MFASAFFFPASTRKGWKNVFGAFTELRKATIIFVMSDCPSVCPSAWNSYAPTGGILMKFDTGVFFFRKSVEKMQVSINLTRITGTLHGDQYIFLVISRLFLLRMINVSDTSCTENQSTHLLFNKVFFFFFFRKSCLLWDNAEKYCRSGQTQDDNMAHAHCKLGT